MTLARFALALLAFRLLRFIPPIAYGLGRIGLRAECRLLTDGCAAMAARMGRWVAKGGF